MPVKDRLFRVATAVHRGLLRATRGRVLGRVAGMPVVVLTTTGRRSGRQRHTVLTAPVVEGERVVLVASYGGDDRHPQWFRNLLEEPDVDITIAGRRRPMTARVATAGEKAALWPRIVAAYAGYDHYQRRTGRDIPVVLVEPRPEGR